MNPLEKALLVQELSQLMQRLAGGSLSYFETAKHKQRLKDIVDFCDRPTLNQQIFGSRSHIQPIAEAEQFLQKSSYKSSCCGIFRNDKQLEVALNGQKQSAWAMLYHDYLGWQIWMIEVPNYTLLISDWGKLTDVYEWMQEEQHDYPFLQTDTKLANQVAKRATKDIPTLTHMVTTTNHVVPLLHEEIIAPAAEELAPPTLVLQGHLHHLSPLNTENFTEKLLFRLVAEQSNDRRNYIDLLGYNVDFEHALERTIYLAEQVNQKGQFIRYVALFGAQNDTQASRMVHAFSHQQHYNLAAIRKISWSDLASKLFDFYSLFEAYNQAEIYWATEGYYPYIPTEFINTQKFIQFDETPADFNTPILLLKERQKIRIIHGKNRVALAKGEHAYPYIMLDRQQGANWKLIQDTIQTMPQPILALQLYEAIQKHITI